MARKIRIEYAGAAYHVVARGNQGRDIYADERDRKLWLATLGEACEKTGWRIHAWVMMNNHYHLLLRIRRGVERAIAAIAAAVHLCLRRCASKQKADDDCRKGTQRAQRIETRVGRDTPRAPSGTGRQCEHLITLGGGRRIARPTWLSTVLVFSGGYIWIQFHGVVPTFVWAVLRAH